jgi:carbonic anhydrase
MSEVDRLKEANASFAERFDNGDLEIPPARPLVVLTCIDARVDPAASLGLQIGDAHVIRNAGGRATDDAIRSLLISSWLLGTREFAVIHHTDCGMTKFTDPVLRDMIRDQPGSRWKWSSSDSRIRSRALGMTSTRSEGAKGSRTA